MQVKASCWGSIHYQTANFCYEGTDLRNVFCLSVLRGLIYCSIYVVLNAISGNFRETSCVVCLVPSCGLLFCSTGLTSGTLSILDSCRGKGNSI